MKTIEIIFLASLFIVFYSYLGYGIVLFGLVRLKRLIYKSKDKVSEEEFPEITLMVPAFNEKDYVHQKVTNTRELDYPKEKLKQVWVTDGSDDGTPDMLKQYDDVMLYHKNERKGKIAAMNRGVKFVDSPIIVFTDANTILSKSAVKEIASLFRDPQVGCVSGEKRIIMENTEAAASAGEGIYWKYESTLKKWDAELYSAVGAAGELFAIRTSLYEEVEADTLLDDFIISLRIAMKGYKIGYNPKAYAIETGSQNVKEELKRKIRISAGGFQSIIRLRALLNPFKYGILSFQYISHRVLRWAASPFLLLLILIFNFYLFQDDNTYLGNSFYSLLLGAQLMFYSFALIGWFFEHRKIKFKVFFIPYYFFVMNYSAYLGLYRYAYGNQSVNWVRAKRSK